MKRLIHRKDQTAHISLQLPSISKSDRNKINWMRRNLFGAPRLIYLCCCFASRNPAVRLAPRRCIAAPPVKGYLRSHAQTCKCFFRESSVFFCTPRPTNKIWYFRNAQPPAKDIFLPDRGTRLGNLPDRSGFERLTRAIPTPVRPSASAPTKARCRDRGSVRQKQPEVITPRTKAQLAAGRPETRQVPRSP